MKKNAYNFSFTSYSSIDVKGKIIKHRNVSFDADYKNLYKSNFIGLSTVMINKKILPLFKIPKKINPRRFCFMVNNWDNWSTHFHLIYLAEFLLKKKILYFLFKCNSSLL